MLYNINDILICRKKINAQCLEMSNPDIDIEIGDKYKVTDKDDYPDENECHWYELTYIENENMILNAWNDEGHMIIDETFVKQ